MLNEKASILGSVALADGIVGLRGSWPQRDRPPQWCELRETEVVALRRGRPYRSGLPPYRFGEKADRIISPDRQISRLVPGTRTPCDPHAPERASGR